MMFCLLQYASCLTGGSFDEARMPQTVEACEWLTNALHGLEVPNLDPTYANMRAVCVLPLLFVTFLKSWLWSLSLTNHIRM